MRVQEEPVCVHLFWKNPVFTSLHLNIPFMSYSLCGEDDTHDFAGVVHLDNYYASLPQA
jgi:hypothetical protein